MLALIPASWLARRPRWVAATLAWAGLGAIAFSTVRFGDGTLFPGYAALVPTLGTAAIIAAGFGIGSAATFAGPARLITLGPVRHVGRISYSWYLWHWPPLVFAAAIWGTLSPLEGMAVLAVSYVPAVLTNRLVEKPFLHSETLTRFPRKALALGGACTASSVALGLLLFALTPTIPEAPESRVAGATALQRDHALQKSAKAVHPTPREAETKENRPRMYADGCHLTSAGDGGPRVRLRRPLLRYHRGALRRLPRYAVVPRLERACRGARLAPGRSHQGRLPSRRGANLQRDVAQGVPRVRRVARADPGAHHARRGARSGGDEQPPDLQAQGGGQAPRRGGEHGGDGGRATPPP